MSLNQHPSPNAEQTLHNDFYVPNRGKGTVTFKVRPNDDPKKYGTTLLFPSHAANDFLGFPVCEGVVQSEQSGYASMYGWIQLVRGCDTVLDDRTAWEFDPLPVTQDIEWPFAWFGPDAALFDGPARVGAREHDWAARSFLTYIEDGVMTKVVRPIMGFEWGFTVRDGVISIKETTRLAGDQWNEHVSFLGGKFPSWTF